MQPRIRSREQQRLRPARSKPRRTKSGIQSADLWPDVLVDPVNVAERNRSMNADDASPLSVDDEAAAAVARLRATQDTTSVDGTDTEVTVAATPTSAAQGSRRSNVVE